jgi:hypothetical protein
MIMIISDGPPVASAGGDRLRLRLRLRLGESGLGLGVSPGAAAGAEPRGPPAEVDGTSSCGRY